MSRLVLLLSFCADSTGEFADETATRMPPMLDQSRDVEFTLGFFDDLNGAADLAVPIPEGINGALISTQLFAFDGAGAASRVSPRSLTFTVL